MKICELKQAIKMATDRRTFSIIGYSLLSMYIYEKMNDRNKRMFALAGSIFGLEVLLNYIQLVSVANLPYGLEEFEEHQNRFQSYNDSMYSNDGNYYQPEYY